MHVAISFDYSYYQKTVPHPNKYVSWMLGRVKLLGDLVKDGIIDTSKPHHSIALEWSAWITILAPSVFSKRIKIDQDTNPLHPSGVKGFCVLIYLDIFAKY